MKELTCFRCGLIAQPVLNVQGPHLGAYCPDCGSWISWIKQPKPDWRTLPATDKQVAFLKRCGFWKEGLTKGDAHDLINGYLNKEKQL